METSLINRPQLLAALQTIYNVVKYARDKGAPLSPQQSALDEHVLAQSIVSLLLSSLGRRDVDATVTAHLCELLLVNACTDSAYRNQMVEFYAKNVLVHVNHLLALGHAGVTTSVLEVLLTYLSEI